MYVCICVYKCVYTHTTTTTKNTLRNKHQWMSAKVPSLEADLFFIKINCVAGAACLSMPPADTSVPLLQQQCVCVSVWCVSMLSNNGSVIRHCQRHMNESEGNSDQKSACSQETRKVYTLNRDMRKEFCYDLFSQMKYCFIYLYYI